MKFISLFVTITVFLTILLPSFAQESEPEKYIVRTVYFLPKDREPRQDIDAKIDKMLKRVQKFYADQMETTATIEKRSGMKPIQTVKLWCIIS